MRLANKLWSVTSSGVTETAGYDVRDTVPTFTSLVEAHEYHVAQVEALAAAMVAKARLELDAARTISDVTEA